MSIINTTGIVAAWHNLMFQLSMAKHHIDENGVADLQTIIFGVAGAVVALIVAVIVLGTWIPPRRAPLTSRAPITRSSRPSTYMAAPRSPCSRSASSWPVQPRFYIIRGSF